MSDIYVKTYQTRLISSDKAEILGFDFPYIVTSDGTIISQARYNNKNLIMKPQKAKDGYLNIGLIKDGRSTAHRVHRIVACAFLTNPENKPYVNHIDGDKTNNNVNNLEWCTQKENAAHSINVLHKWSSSPKQSKATQDLGLSHRKLTMDDAREIRKIYASGEMGSYRLSKRFGINKKSVLDIIHYRSYKESEDLTDYGVE